MISFIYFLNTFFNFFFGLYVPLIPIMNENLAGIAFSAYGIAKIATYYMFGSLVDKNQMRATLIICLILFLFVPILYLFFPVNPSFAKLIEGVAFAGGTVFCFSFLSIVSHDKASFEKSLKKVLVFTSFGALLGPVLGYLFVDGKIPLASYIFLGASIGMLAIGLLLLPKLKFLDTNERQLQVDDSRSETLNWNLVFIILILKGILVGFQPCIAYWAKDVYQFSSLLSALAFLVTGVAFVAGTMKPRFGNLFLPIIAIACLEGSFIYSSHLFWVTNVLLSFWLGQTMIKCMVDLGWVTTDKAGKLNSFWLVVSDIPLMFTPAMFWSIREVSYSFCRVLVFVCSFIMVFFLINKDSKKMN